MGIWAKIAATWSVGPPIRVVPVSIAAYDDEPEASVIELPFTVKVFSGSVQYVGVLVGMS